MGEYDFPLLSRQYLRGKAASDDLRQAVALAISDKCLRPNLEDPAAIAALDAAQAYRRGEIDKKALHAARRMLTRTMDENETKSLLLGSTRVLTRTAYFATLFPIKWSEFDSMVAMILNGLTNKECENDSSLAWDDCQRRVNADQYRIMAEIMLAILPAEARNDWTQKQLSRYHFDDGRFAMPHFEDWLLLLVSKGATSKELDETRRVLDAFQQCQGAEPIERERIQPIIDASVGDKARTRKLAFEILTFLAPYSVAAREALLAALRNRSGQIRFEAVSLCGFYRLPNPLSFLLEFFETALNDRSAKVRLFASQESVTQRRPELLPLVERAAARESDIKVRKAMMVDQGLIRDGFHAEDDPENDEIRFTVLFPEGGMASNLIAREKFATMTRADLEKLAAEIRRDSGY